MGNANAKDGIHSKGAEDSFSYAGDGVLLPEEARVKGSMNGSSALHDMIAQGQHPPANTNVVSRYQQMSGHAGWLGDGQGWSFLEGTHGRSRVMDPASTAAASLKSPNAAGSHPSSISATQTFSEEQMLKNSRSPFAIYGYP